MPHRSLDDLSLHELEELIQQRRAGKQSLLHTKPISTKHGRRWDKALLVLEILLILAFLLVFGISARGWLALRQKLPIDGVTLLAAPALAASLDESTGLTLPPPIGLRQSRLSGQSASSGVEAQNLSPEVPAHLKKWLQPAQLVGSVILPEPVAQPATRIIIPSINVDAPVGEGLVD